MRGNNVLWQRWGKRPLGSDDLSLIVYDNRLSCNIRRLDHDRSNLMGVLKVEDTLIIHLSDRNGLTVHTCVKLYHFVSLLLYL